MTSLPDNPASTNGFFIPVHGILNAVSELNDKYY